MIPVSSARNRPFRRGGVLFVSLLLLVTMLPRTLRSEASPPFAREGEAQKTSSVSPGISLYLLDFALPGYGSFRSHHPVEGTLLATGRLATLYLADRYYAESQEYRSLWQAARYGDLLYGPGTTYWDPFEKGFHTTQEFRRKADRRTYYGSLAVTTHLLMAALSLYLTWDRVRREAESHLPRFPVQQSDKKSEGNSMERGDAMDGNGWSLQLSPALLTDLSRKSSQRGIGTRAFSPDPRTKGAEGDLISLQYRFTLRDF